MNSTQKQLVLAKLEGLKRLVGQLAGLTGGPIQKSGDSRHYLRLAAFVGGLKPVKTDLAAGIKPSADGIREALGLAVKAGAKVDALPDTFRVAWRDYGKVGPEMAARLDEQVRKLVTGGAMAGAAALTACVDELLSLVDHRDLAAAKLAAVPDDDAGAVGFAKLERDYAETAAEVGRLNEAAVPQQDRRRVEAETRLLKLSALRKSRRRSG